MPRMSVTSRQYRYPNLTCHMERAENEAPDQLDIPVNRKTRTNRVRIVR